MTKNKAAKRPLMPREHGAYGQLMLPIVAALAISRPTIASACVVVAALAAFFSHESLIVLTGKRGTRAKREDGGRAILTGSGWVSLSLVAGAIGLWLGGKPVMLAALIPFGVALALVPIILRGYQKSLAGEITATMTLTAASIPVAVAGGLDVGRASFFAGTWLLGFVASTGAVRWVIAAHKGRRAGDALTTTIVATVAAAAFMTRSWVFVFASPYLIASWILIVRPPSARHLRRVGWTLLGAGILTAASAVTVVRIP